MTAIRQANITSNRPFITEIWKVCFTNDTEYINLFIDYCLPYSTTWLLEKEHRAVSLLTLIPSYFTDIKSSSLSNGGYIYGVGTLPDYRGHSYSKALLERAASYAKDNHLDYLIVRPAYNSLYPLYERAGFEIPLFENELQEELGEIVPNAAFTDISPKELLLLRENQDIFLWPIDILIYTTKEILMRGGVVAVKDGLYYCAYPLDSDPDTVCVLETNARSEHEINQIMSSAKSRYPQAKSVIIKGRFLSSMSMRQNRSGLLFPISEGSKFNHPSRLSLPME